MDPLRCRYKRFAASGCGTHIEQRQMSPEQLTPQLLDAIAILLGCGHSVTLTPPGLLANGGGAAPRPRDPELDFLLPEYRERFAPQVSENTLRDWCADGYFPDTGAGETAVPGAYKDILNRWRITREGIAERQRLDRMAGLKRKRGEAADRSGVPSTGEVLEPAPGATAEALGSLHGVQNGGSVPTPPAVAKKCRKTAPKTVPSDPSWRAWDK